MLALLRFIFENLRPRGCGEDSGSLGPAHSHTRPGASHPAHAAGLVLWAHPRCRSLNLVCDPVPLGQLSGQVAVLCGCAHIKCVCWCAVCVQVCAWLCVPMRVRVHVCPCMLVCSCVHVCMCICVCLGSPGVDWGQASILGRGGHFLRALECDGGPGPLPSPTTHGSIPRAGKRRLPLPAAAGKLG